MPSERFDDSVAPVESPTGEEAEEGEPTSTEPLDAGVRMEDGNETEDADAVLTAMDADTLVDSYVAEAGSDNDAIARDATSFSLSDANDSEAGGGLSPDAGLCAPPGLDVWRAAHLKSDIRDRITTCRIDCDGDVACADLCLRHSAGIEDCHPCTRAEADCSARFCSYACLPSRTDQTCLACLCQADCVGAFETCAGQQLNLCRSELFTFSSAPGGPSLDTVALLMGKSTTGTLSSTRFDPTTELFGDEFAPINHFPSGATKLIPASLGDRELVLQYGTNCNVAPCVVRGYPVLRDGSFGAPLFEERWDAGYVDASTFVFAGRLYLVRLRDTAGSGAENVLIDRLVWNAETQLVQREAVVRATFVPVNSPGYSRVEPFLLGDGAFMLLLAPESGEGTVVRLQDSATGMELRVAADPIAWSRGWDLVEGFKSSGHFYMFAYKSGRVAVDQEPAGQARIWQPRLDAQARVTFDQPVFDETWGPGTTHVVSFTDPAGDAHVALYQEALGRLDWHRLRADPGHWHDDFLVPQQTQSRGRTPPWDVLELLKDGKW